jgi:hypothetical protein
LGDQLVFRAYINFFLAKFLTTVIQCLSNFYNASCLLQALAVSICILRR